MLYYNFNCGFSGKGDKSLLEVIELIRGDDTIYNSMKEKTATSSVIARMRTLMDHYGNDILKVNMLIVYTQNDYFLVEPEQNAI